MLKKTLLVREKIDIFRYSSLICILKNKTKGYKPRQSLVFETEDVMKFWRETSNDECLFEKIISIMGIFGTCRSCELHILTIDDVKDRGDVMVNRRDTKTNVNRNFGIIGDENGINPVDIVRKYRALRLQHVAHNFFFVNYRNGKCTEQLIGIN
ncbi:hypothetical protein Zmor_006640 [Zophobas morio]|uniref:Uncharacterized protein n=1 Tax=Zophobas morio TaxID=2755281 RepID=A0AA38MLK7_9CUCU|nr:hypothetical protein Zmor_006640 [Zophobas morio]